MEKFIYSSELPHIYKLRKGTVSIVTIPSQKIIYVLGSGPPEINGDFSNAVKILYIMANKLKFECKKLQQQDFKIFPMEGAWWLDDPTLDFSDPANRVNWKWMISIPIPDFVSDETWKSARKLFEKKTTSEALGHLSEKLIVQNRPEQLVAQTLHIGSYENETPTIQRIKTFVMENGFLIDGCHHEIYLTDPSKTKVENLKTIIRYPIKVTDDPVYRREIIKLLSFQNGLSAMEIAKRMNLNIEDVLAIIQDEDLLLGIYKF